MATNPLMEPTLMIEPLLRFCIARTAYFEQKLVPNRPTFNTLIQSSRVASSTSLWWNEVALFTRMSRRCQSSRTRETILSAPSSEETSSLRLAPAPPASRISWATCLAFGPSMSTTRTRQPSRANERHVARPIPEPPPVTIAVFCASLIVSLSHQRVPLQGRPCPAMQRVAALAPRSCPAELQGSRQEAVIEKQKHSRAKRNISRRTEPADSIRRSRYQR